MALAYAQSLGDGTNRVFTVPFPYISKTHVQVKVDGNVVPFTWLSDTSVQLATAPKAGSIVDRRRVTPRDTLLVDFVDGSTLVESDLDLSALQVFYLSQEAFDQGEASLGVTDDGSFSGLGRRISNVLDPVETQDVATKHFVETGVTSQVVIATGKANEAANSATAAANSANAAANSATAANNSKNAAASSATAAAQSEANALASRTQTGKDAAATAADRVQTGLDRVAADASAQAAAQSAAQAALFDPSSYYTKAQITQSYYSKTDIDTKVSALNTAIGGKQANLGYAPVNRAGDIMTGPLEIKDDPTLWLHRPNVKRARWVIDAYGSVLWQDQGGQTHFYITNTGGVWTQQFGDLYTQIENRANAWGNAHAANCVTSSQMAGYVEVLMSNGSVINNSAYVLTMAQRVSGDQYRFGSRQPQLYIQNRGWFAAFPF
ncbi:phage tail fiber protein [Rhizobium sp. IMFF44]|uniref:phage tail fiber domain-containing protein n=1 Tax=Rhizobium sp. IMFF44 TaxID=3342350 RepID=UPI0035BA9B5F